LFYFAQGKQLALTHQPNAAFMAGFHAVMMMLLLLTCICLMLVLFIFWRSPEKNINMNEQTI